MFQSYRLAIKWLALARDTVGFAEDQIDQVFSCLSRERRPYIAPKEQRIGSIIYCRQFARSQDAASVRNTVTVRLVRLVPDTDQQIYFLADGSLTKLVMASITPGASGADGSA